ncbi:MAG: beta-N-acetylhexosaminidase [Candidatus Magnetomorum sp.]|nr:beta-N-acetylhexosaminidase [Candidatus Magnetomorum sp.]
MSNDPIMTKDFSNISMLSLREKIGLLLMVGISGHHPDKIVQQRMEQQYISAYLLFQKNTPSLSVTKSLTDELKQMAEHYLLSPLLIAIDQEQGRVIRIKNGITRLPAAYALGRLNNPQYVHDACFISGCELRSLGININFAPVADINSNPDNPIIGTRSFGENPVLVSEMVRHAIRGYHDTGIICSAKHFPGHGDVSIDSHLDLPVSEKNIDQLYQTELLPFEVAISESVPMIMTAHISYPKIDSQWPATLSPTILTQLLRKKMKYQGVIISDDLEMKALNQCGPHEDLAVQMIIAGCDMLIISENLTHEVSVDNIYQALFQAVQNQIISEDRLNESVQRILRLRQRVVKQEGCLPGIREPQNVCISHQMMREVFFNNPHGQHFPISVDPDNLLILSDKEDLLNICPHLQTHRLLLTKNQSLEQLQAQVRNKDEVFIFLSQFSFVSILQEIDWPSNQKIRFFSLNNPYIQSTIHLPCASYINLYAECLPLEIFDELLIIT